jgi:hypothetical protein
MFFTKYKDTLFYQKFGHFEICLTKKAGTLMCKILIIIKLSERFQVLKIAPKFTDMEMIRIYWDYYFVNLDKLFLKVCEAEVY